MSKVDGATSLENGRFRDLKNQLRRLKAGGTHASVLQSLANMCREEESIADQQTYDSKRGCKNVESSARESFWKRRFVIRGSESHYDEQDSSLFAKYAKQKCQPSQEATVTPETTFSTNVQELLLAMTSQFASDINEAYVSDPSQVMARSENNPDEVVLNICQVASNMKNIDEDMRKLAEAKSRGKMTADNRFTGFSRLGEEDYLMIDEGASPSNASDDSETSHCTSDSDDSDDVSEWDSDDESSLDSNFMAEMANELGFDIDDEEDDVTVTSSSIATRSIASRQKFIPHFSSMMKLREASSHETQFTDESCCDSSINTEVQSRSYYPANFKAGGMDEPETSNWMSSQQIMPKSYAAIKAAEYREPDVIASPDLSVHHGFQRLKSVRPQTEFGGDAESGGDDCDVDEAEASDDESARSYDDDLNPTDSAPWSSSEICNERHECDTPSSMVSTPHDKLVTLFTGIPQSATGRSSPYQPSCSSPLPGAATPIALDTMSQPVSYPIQVNHQSESESDDDSDDNSDYDSDDDSDVDSDEESDYMAQFEALYGRTASGQTLPAVPLQCRKVAETPHPSPPVTRAASQCSLVSQVSTRTLHAITAAPSGIGTNVGCFDATGRPNKKAAIRGCQRLGIISGHDCRYLSDLSIAARLATAVDEDVAPFGRAETSSRHAQSSLPVDSSELYKSAPCATENRCRDEIGRSRHRAEPECREVSMHSRLLSLRFNHNTDGTTVDDKLLVDWKTPLDDLLVSWGDGADSDSDTCVEVRLVGRSSGSHGEDELEQKPIVSNWNARQSYCDEGVAVKRPSEESVPQPCHVSCDASLVSSDRELDQADRESKGPVFCVDYPEHAKEKLFIGVDFRDSDAVSPVSTVSAAIPRVAIRGRSPRSTIRQQASGRRVSFRDAFKALALSEDDLHEQDKDVRRNLQREAVFPRVDFPIDRTRRTRRKKRGESDSQSTRRRRKYRENEIKSAMGVEQCYIEGLCMINQSQGIAIACKIKSQM